jgi:SAM-dependent methyltransferase
VAIPETYAGSVSSEHISAASSPDWKWDSSLYAGSARFYSMGRVAYPAELVAALVAALELDGTGRLLDVGCGPGSLTLLLARHFAEAVGIDPDPSMLSEAARLAADNGVRNVTWRQLRAEELPTDLAPARLVTFAHSFHWMDRPRVARTVRDMLTDDGAVVHVHATTHQGLDSGAELPYPRPPRAQITDLVHRYLGPDRRAGKGTLTNGTPNGEDAIYRAAGLTGPQRLEIPGLIVDRTTDQVTASVYSLSSAAPHLFADRLEQFDADLRRLVADTARDGRFSEELLPIAIDIWR